MSNSEPNVMIAANPKSGATESGPKVAKLREHLNSNGFATEVIYNLAEIASRAPKLFEKGQLRAVVAAGGDGTADALANLLPHNIPLQLFPLGTENLLAKYLQIRTDVEQSLDILREQRCVQMDVGLANDKVFLVMASIGFDAQVVQEMDAVRKGHIRRWSYAMPIMRAIWKYRFPQLRVSARTSGNSAASETDASEPDSDLESYEPLDGSAWNFIFNVPRYAASLDFCHQADPLDGQLDLCQFKKSGLIWGTGYLTRLFFKSHQSMKGFQHTRITQLRIEAPEGVEVPFQIDGDPGGVLPLTIRVLPKRITMLVPREFTPQA
ncbi:MAG: diacylglycerol kinase family protein [Planctomycetota bacterium]